VQTRRLGRTEHRSSVAVLGAAALFDGTSEAAEQALYQAMAAGVNHLDIAPQYGKAQELLGPFLPAVRDQLFVGCKTLRHSADGVRAQLEDSLRILGCSSFDLYQMHAVTNVAELDRRQAAVTAILKARDEGLCRWVGITGHDLSAPAAHLEALRRYDLDTVMFPVNPRLWADPAYRHDAEALLTLCAERDLGVMAIKAAAARPWGQRPHSASTWYEPYTARSAVERGVYFTLSIPGVQAFCTPGDLGVLTTALAAANAYVPMDEAARDRISAEVAGEEHIFPMAQ
jgi:aryl-alcohol dehydrogenase-like predicted oxidoreductase